MAHIHRPYGSEYYESEREVIRDSPYGGYSAEYRVDEYDNRIPHRHNGIGNIVSEVVSEVIPGGRRHHHPYGGGAEIIDRREERIVDSSYDPYRRIY